MSTINSDEINNFESMAGEWWDRHGKLKPLHKLNPTRIDYLTRQICNHFGRNDIKGLDILDVGCGGGLVCEPLAQTGANVVGIDAGENAIAIAQSHASDNGLDITYKCEASTDHKGHYDVVLALEIIEHVDNVDDFVKSVCALLKPNGIIIFSTLNRTAKSYALGIIAAEYILRWLPTGTHSWKKFIKPSELARHVQSNDMKVNDITGLVYNPILDQFLLSNADISVNYFLSAVHAS
jgi:2-polyprenyl-6-hydroxyphenyl methylase/3-demethylubiquinone-9 3-methyltransferase